MCLRSCFIFGPLFIFLLSIIFLIYHNRPSIRLHASLPFLFPVNYFPRISHIPGSGLLIIISCTSFALSASYLLFFFTITVTACTASPAAAITRRGFIFFHPFLLPALLLKLNYYSQNFVQQWIPDHILTSFFLPAVYQSSNASRIAFAASIITTIVPSPISPPPCIYHTSFSLLSFFISPANLSSLLHQNIPQLPRIRNWGLRDWSADNHFATFFLQHQSSKIFNIT